MKLYDGSFDCCYICGWDYTAYHSREEVHDDYRGGFIAPDDLFLSGIAEFVLQIEAYERQRLDELKRRLKI